MPPFPSVCLHGLHRDSSNLTYIHGCHVCLAAVVHVTRRLVTTGCFVFTLVQYWAVVRKLRDAQGPRKVTGRAVQIHIMCLIPPVISWFPLILPATNRSEPRVFPLFAFVAAVSERWTNLKGYHDHTCCSHDVLFSSNGSKIASISMWGPRKVLVLRRYPCTRRS
jgi:hypothetical protein